MKIEAGRYYKTRDGRKVGPMKLNTRGEWSGECDGESWGYHGNGNWGQISGGLDVKDRNPYRVLRDLIAPWPTEPTGPVRTVTRKEIVPGVYGGLEVGSAIDGHVFIAMGIQRVDAEAIDALIANMTAIRDALEDS